MSEWAKYGFPNPGFMLMQRPLEALWKALWERRIYVVKTDFTLQDILDKEYVPVMSRASNSTFASFDALLKDTLPYYINHLLPDGGTPWTWETLSQAALKNNETLRLWNSEPVLEYDCSLLWLLQRYRMVNLLKKVKVYFEPSCVLFFGYTHNGIPSSMQESLDSALETGSSFHSKNPNHFGVRLNGIYGPDHGWREGSYCCNADIFKSAYLPEDLELPEGVEPTDCHFTFTAENANPDGTFSGMGTGVTEGFNSYTADDDGVFFSWTPTAHELETPTKGHQTYKGFRLANVECYYTAEPQFIFQDDI